MTAAMEADVARVIDLLEAEAKAGGLDPGLPSVEQQRQHHERQVSRFTPPGTRASVQSIEDHVVPGPAGLVPIRVYRPLLHDQRALPTMVWLHGGGWVTGSLETADVLAREACAVGMVVVSVGYRRAPEAPFPAAPDDCLAALSWACNAVDELGGDSRRLAVGGDSAGGNLAAVLAQQAPGAGIRLAAQLLLYPVVDLDLRPGRYGSRAENDQGPMFTVAELERLVQLYLGPAPDPADPRASPIRAGDLSGLAPAVVLTADLDPLRDEGYAYAAALHAAGVPVRHHRAAGLPHCVLDMLDAVPAARTAVSRALKDTRVLLDAAAASAP